MATNYDLLKAELQTKANALEEAARKYKALILIDQYIACLEQQAASTATDVTSYSIGGRSVTRRGTGEFSNTVARLESELNEIFYGNISLADFRVNSVDQVTA